jgi:hypothetical protein
MRVLHDCPGAWGLAKNAERLGEKQQVLGFQCMIGLGPRRLTVVSGRPPDPWWPWQQI